MGILNILKNVFNKDKKVVILGLDNSGKSTLVSFLQTGTYIEHTPTMGKQKTEIEVQGVGINLIDMGGQQDFRTLWLGELSDAECVIFMLDAHDIKRFDEAKRELWKLSKIIKNKALVILANKYDLENVAPVSEIIEYMELMKLHSFEVLPISCKTGYGIVNAFSKIYFKLSGKKLTKKIAPKALTIFDQAGIPLTMRDNTNILRGGLYAAITSFVKESFNAELNQLKFEGNVIIFKKSENFMGSIILDEAHHLDINEAEIGLKELLIHLENVCPEVQYNELEPEKVQYLVNEYSTNLFSKGE